MVQVIRLKRYRENKIEIVTNAILVIAPELFYENVCVDINKCMKCTVRMYSFVHKGCYDLKLPQSREF